MEAVACGLDKNQLTDYPPHTEVRNDLNADGIADYFYLTGSEDYANTCVYLGEKKGAKKTFKLVYEDKDAYDVILDLNGDGKPELLAPEIPKSNGLEDICPVDAIPNDLREKTTRLYEKWAKGFESYNFTYEMPAFYPVYNLFLPYKVKIYSFQKNGLRDVTRRMKDYLELKTEVLNALLSSTSTTPECKAVCESTKVSLPPVPGKM